MHVFQFFLQFLLVPHIEIVKLPLPKCSIRISIAVKRKFPLTTAAALLRPQFTRNLLFQYLQGLRRISHAGFAHQEMDMFRHHHIPHQLEPVSHSNLIQDLHKPISRPYRPKIRSPSITTKCHEVQIAFPEIPLQRIASAFHRFHPTSKPAPLTRRVRHPPDVCFLPRLVPE
jgi:hypothetical protein